MPKVLFLPSIQSWHHTDLSLSYKMEEMRSSMEATPRGDPQYCKIEADEDDSSDIQLLESPFDVEVFVPENRQIIPKAAPSIADYLIPDQLITATSCRVWTRLVCNLMNLVFTHEEQMNCVVTQKNNMLRSILDQDKVRAIVTSRVVELVVFDRDGGGLPAGSATDEFYEYASEIDDGYPDDYGFDTHQDPWPAKFELPHRRFGVDLKMALARKEKLDKLMKGQFLQAIYDEVTQYTYYPSMFQYAEVVMAILVAFPHLANSDDAQVSERQWTKSLRNKFCNHRRRHDFNLMEVQMKRKKADALPSSIS